MISRHYKALPESVRLSFFGRADIVFGIYFYSVRLARSMQSLLVPLCGSAIRKDLAQEHRAERVSEKLRELLPRRALVVRDGVPVDPLA